MTLPIQTNEYEFDQYGHLVPLSEDSNPSMELIRAATILYQEGLSANTPMQVAEQFEVEPVVELAQEEGEEEEAFAERKRAAHEEWEQRRAAHMEEVNQKLEAEREENKAAREELAQERLKFAEEATGKSLRQPEAQSEAQPQYR